MKLDVKPNPFLPIWHFGTMSDPIFAGECVGPSSICYHAGFAMETKCHTGNVCLLDFEGRLDIRTMYSLILGKNYLIIGNHQLKNVLSLIQKAEEFDPICFMDIDCEDCNAWTFVE